MMATIKVKLRPSSVADRAGTIYYQVTHGRAVRRITTDIRIRPDDWNEASRTVSARGGGRLQNRIDSDVSFLQQIIRELENSRRRYSADDIVHSFRTSERQTFVLAFFREQIDFLTACNRLGTAINYRRAAAALAGFLRDGDLRFSEFTSQFVEVYNDYLLRKGMVRNSLSFHMRILRAVYNKAVRRGYVEQSFPFRDVYTGIDRTRKRAVGEEILSRLLHLDLTGRPTLAFARDLFLFSFYTRGMAFVDMAYLKRSDIQAGVIRYARRKTGQLLTVRVEPCMQAIIDRYADRVRSTPYLFPLLREEPPATTFRRYKTELRAYNARLAQLAALLDLEQGLSSYTSRHSWATMARNHQIPLSVISAGMGHTSERTTRIYLASLENGWIDDANRTILAALK